MKRNRDAEQLRSINQHRIGATLPGEKWIWYQEWNNVLFLHWRIDADVIRKLVPAPFTLDTYNDEAWVSLVAFTMQHIRPRQLPHVSFISNFHEVNVRTYVTDGARQGVYFLSIEAGKLLSAYLSRRFSGLPYKKSTMHRKYGAVHTYQSVNTRTSSSLNAKFRPGDGLSNKTGLDKWLTERYYLFMNGRGGPAVYPVHHPEWELNHIDIFKLELSYRANGLELSHRDIDLIHYSPGVKVIAWPADKL